jgi:hypothetical protein
MESRRGGPKLPGAVSQLERLSVGCSLVNDQAEAYSGRDEIVGRAGRSGRPRASVWLGR